MNSLMGCFADCPFGILDGFFTSNPTNPEKRWPGTKWRQIKGRFILAADDTHPAGSTGGEFEHKLTVDEMPKHDHNTAKGEISKNAIIQMDKYQTYQSESSIAPGKYWTAYTTTSGGDKPHNNTPPYFSMYFWQRTA